MAANTSGLAEVWAFEKLQPNLFFTVDYRYAVQNFFKSPCAFGHDEATADERNYC